jgi:hypothetical protein
LYATLVLAGNAAAQIPGIGVRLVPKAGLYHPLGDVTEGLRAQDHLALGVAAELELPFLPVGVRANVDHTSATDIHDDAGARVGKVAITNIVGDLVLSPVPGIIPVQPYLFAGGGVKQYRFSEFSSSVFGSDDDRSDPTLHVGAGVELNLLVVGVVLEAGDYLSRFEFGGSSKLQNDVYGMLGVRVGLF